jgi:hypothetical protein
VEAVAGAEVVEVLKVPVVTGTTLDDVVVVFFVVLEVFTVEALELDVTGLILDDVVVLFELVVGAPIRPGSADSPVAGKIRQQSRFRPSTMVGSICLAKTILNKEGEEIKGVETSDSWF